MTGVNNNNMPIYLNVRQDLTRETKNNMLKQAREKKVTLGNLLNQTFK